MIGDELRLVEGVALSCVIKTYPDGKLTARLRGNLPIADTVAGYFGGGGHPYAAGFRVYESYDEIARELVAATDQALQQNIDPHAINIYLSGLLYLVALSNHHSHQMHFQTVEDR